IEGRIKELEDKLARAEVIDPTKMGGDRVAFGCRVKLSNTETEEEVEYRILGADEADVKNGTIGITSPLARSLRGKQAGHEGNVKAPSGLRVYEVLAVSFG